MSVSWKRDLTCYILDLFLLIGPQLENDSNCLAINGSVKVEKICTFLLEKCIDTSSSLISSFLWFLEKTASSNFLHAESCLLDNNTLIQHPMITTDSQ